MKVTNRPGRGWVVDYYDFGKRRIKAFQTKRDAEDFKAETQRKQKQRVKPTVDAHITLTDFAPLFLARCCGLGIKARTIERYETALRVHILAALGTKRVRDLDRPTIEGFIIGKRNEAESRQGQRGSDMEGRRKLAKGTVLHLLMTVSGLTCAVPWPYSSSCPIRSRA